MVWGLGVARAAKVGGDFCATRDRAELEQKYGPLRDGFKMRTDLIPPRATCIFRTKAGERVTVSEFGF
ncbi:MAG: hypothetical protein QOF21_530 [Actinomycetota bacterium]|jgi:hypothetical protein